MFERIKLAENGLGMSSDISQKYAELVENADVMRMLYASHHMKRRDSVLPIIQKELLKLMEDERRLLIILVNEMERKLSNETLEVS